MLPILPKIYQKKPNFRLETLSTQTGFADDASNTYDYPEGGTLVFRHSDGKLRPVATDGVSVLGWVGDKWKGDQTGPNPPVALRGNKKDVVNPVGVRFAITISNDANTVGDTGPKFASAAIGSSFGLTRPTTGAYLDYQMLNVQETSLTLFTVVEHPTQYNGVTQDANTTNPVVIVELIASKIQAA